MNAPGTLNGGNAAGFRYFDILMALFVAVLLISNIASTKIVTLWKFTFDGGPSSFPSPIYLGMCSPRCMGTAAPGG